MGFISAGSRSGTSCLDKMMIAKEVVDDGGRAQGSSGSKFRNVCFDLKRSADAQAHYALSAKRKGPACRHVYVYRTHTRTYRLYCTQSVFARRRSILEKVVSS